MSFARYPVCKDSGVEWLGKVPAHWDLTPLKHLADFVNGDAFKPVDWAESGIPIIRIQNLNGGDDFNYFDGTVEDRYLVRDGDLLFGWSGNRGTSFGPFIWRKEGVYALNQHIFRVVPFWIDKSDLYWVLKAVTAHVEDQAHGIIGMVHVTKGDLGSIKVPVPPPEEQTAIATFLDRETAKIDALVAEQEKLIALLQEKRQAVISHAVTKGLDPNVLMKDSGVEWLGEVPAHWEVKRLRNVATLNPSKSEMAHLPRDTEVSFLPMEAIGEDGALNLDRTRPIGEVESGYTYFREEDVTIAKITPCFENGKGAVMRRLHNGHGFGTTELIVARPSDGKVASGYLHLLFTSRPFRRLGEASMYGAGGQKRVPDDFVRNFAVAFPPPEEQTAIATFLDRETAKLYTLMTEARTAITLLQERRIALISAAVTGKIDVRGWAQAGEASNLIAASVGAESVGG